VQIAEGDEDGTCPIDGPGEIRDTGCQAKRERATGWLTGKRPRSTAPSGQRDQQGDERDPRACRMAETGECKREQDARGQR